MVLYKRMRRQKPSFAMMAATYSCVCLVFLLWHWPSPTLACSSRSVPKPRPSSIRSNVIPTTADTFISSNSNGKIVKSGDGSSGASGNGGSSFLFTSKSATVGTTSSISTIANAKTTFKTGSSRSANNKKIVSVQQQQQQQSRQQQVLSEGNGVPATNSLNYKITLTTSPSTTASSFVNSTSSIITTITTTITTRSGGSSSSDTTGITTTTTTTMSTSSEERKSGDLIGFTTTSTIRPNITFPTFKCPANYDAWYCLNEATCFTVKIGDSVMYNCECAMGFMGPRCEYKELDGSYQPRRPKPILEKASVANGATCFLLFFLFLCLLLYVRCDPGRAIYLLSPRPHQQLKQQQILGLGNYGISDIRWDGVEDIINRMGKRPVEVGIAVFKSGCEGDGRRGHRKYLNNGQQTKEDDEIDFTTRNCCSHCCTQLLQKQTRRIL